MITLLDFECLLLLYKQMLLFSFLGYPNFYIDSLAGFKL
jgi:hypothetical protein